MHNKGVAIPCRWKVISAAALGCASILLNFASMILHSTLSFASALFSMIVGLFSPAVHIASAGVFLFLLLSLVSVAAAGEAAEQLGAAAGSRSLIGGRTAVDIAWLR